MSKATDSWPPEGQGLLKLLEKEEEQRKARDEQNSDAAYLREAIEHADQLMAAAVERVNVQTDGHAWGHPALIGAFMQAAATVMAANIIARSTEWAGTAISRATELASDS